MPNLIDKYPNVVAVDVNLDALWPNGEPKGHDTEFLADMKFDGLPSAVQVNPYGLTMKFASGQSDIEKMLDGLKDRKYKEPVQLEEK